MTSHLLSSHKIQLYFQIVRWQPVLLVLSTAPSGYSCGGDLECRYFRYILHFWLAGCWSLALCFIVEFVSEIYFADIFHWLFCGIEDLELFRNDVNYWLVLTCMVLAYTITLLTLSVVGHIIACSLLGSYAVIAAFSHYIGANLQYIVANMFRRATVENFNLAMIDPPYQEKGNEECETIAMLLKVFLFRYKPYHILDILLPDWSLRSDVAAERQAALSPTQGALDRTKQRKYSAACWYTTRCGVHRIITSCQLDCYWTKV